MRGLDTFRRYFEDCQSQYVLIGGAACDVIFSEIEPQSFRLTKDLDLVIVVEALNPEFGKRFWSFVEAGGYENRATSSGKPQFYRFDKPKDDSFPYMIELFGRNSFELADADSHLTPLSIGEDISSLSAILLDDDYYQMLLNGRASINGLTVLSETVLIPFKAKAWLDLTARKEQGVQGLSKDIKKHRNDVVRLASLLTGDEVCRMPMKVQQDMRRFLEAYRAQPVNPRALGLQNVAAQDILAVLDAVYGEGERLGS